MPWRRGVKPVNDPKGIMKRVFDVFYPPLRVSSMRVHGASACRESSQGCTFCRTACAGWFFGPEWGHARMCVANGHMTVRAAGILLGTGARFYLMKRKEN